MSAPDDDTVTDDDLKAARERWADAQHEPAVTELFSEPVYGPGFRGDLPIPHKVTDADLLPE